MTPPQPKSEIVVTRHEGASLTIHVTSADAETWVTTHAGQYGRLLPLTGGIFILYISPAYDAEEVARYIEALGS